MRRDIGAALAAYDLGEDLLPDFQNPVLKDCRYGFGLDFVTGFAE